MADSSTLAQLRTEFYARGFDYLQDGASHTRANRFINQGYMDVLAADDWPFLLVNDQDTNSEIVLATSGDGQLKTIEMVVDVTTNAKLRPINRNDIPDGQITQTGTPSHYWVQRYADVSDSIAAVNIWPVTNSHLIRVYYYKLPEPLASDSDPHAIPAWYESAILQYACAYAYMDSDNPQMAAVARAEGDRIVMQMRMNIMWDSLDFPQEMQRVVGAADALGYGGY